MDRSSQLADAHDPWLRVFNHANSLASSHRPGKRWLKEADELLECVSGRVFGRRLARLIDDEPDGLNRGLVEFLVLARSSALPDSLSASLGAAAERCFQRVPGHGPRDQPTGNLCVKALASCGTGGAAQLEALLVRVHYPSARKRIEAALDGIAVELAVSRAELAELAVPDFGLDRHGFRCIRINEWAAQIEITDDAAVDLRWLTTSGRLQKSTPAPLRRVAPGRVNETKSLARAIGSMLGAQRRRIELLLREQRSWSYAAWQVRFMEHPLVAPTARTLIWLLQANTGPELVIEHDGEFVGAGGDTVRPLEDGQVSLWHPLESDEQTVRAWRVFVEERGTRQAFKQAHREVFPLGTQDGPDRRHSTRFAGRVVRQAQFAALCRSCDWRYEKQGGYHSIPKASIALPLRGLIATLDVPKLAPSRLQEGVDPFVTVGSLRFESTQGESVHLDGIPPRLFSETMRDVSLFASVAGIARTPAWQTAPPELRSYFRDAVFTELSAMGGIRREFLERRLSELPHSDRLSLDDRSLIVRGELNTYRVHLDSAQVLIAPDGPLLSIPENDSSRAQPDLKPPLPFEDPTLLLVLSLTDQLARDYEIDDAFVRVQLR